MDAEAAVTRILLQPERRGEPGRGRELLRLAILSRSHVPS